MFCSFNKQMLNPLSKAINKALNHNVSRSNNRQGQPTSQNLQKSIVRTSSPDHHRAVSRDSKTSSPDHHKAISRDTKSTSPDNQKLIPRNREAKQVANPKIQKSNNHNTQHDTQHDTQHSEAQRSSNRQISANMRQDTSRGNTKVSVRNNIQVQTARPETNREAVQSRTTARKNVQQNNSRDDLQPNGRDIHYAAPKSSNVAPPGSSTQVSSVNRIRSSTKRKR
jgi:hypothetical protein